jgi:hypothetical protein
MSVSAISNLPSNITTASHRRPGASMLLCVLAAMLFAASDASAQGAQRESAASVPARTPYQAFLLADCPGGGNFCKFVSEDVPAGGLLEIQRVACQGWHINEMPPAFTVIAELRTSANAFVKRIDFLNVTYTTANWGKVWAISEQTLMFIPAGHRLHVNLNSGSVGVGSYGCTISGYLTIN